MGALKTGHFLLLGWEIRFGAPTKKSGRKFKYPDSSLSTGGPRKDKEVSGLRPPDFQDTPMRLLCGRGLDLESV